MKTSTGLNYHTLFSDVTADGGKLYLALKVPMTVEFNEAWFHAAIPHMQERIATEKKPGGTYEKCIEQIALHSDLLAKAYVKLHETYTYATTPQTRSTSSGTVAAVDAARAQLLAAVKDDKLLRAMCIIYIGDAASEYILPDERAQLISATVTAMRVSATAGVSE